MAETQTPSEPIILRFPNDGEGFSGLHAAERWLEAHGYSVGSLQGPSPVGILHGNYSISKWRNLNTAHRKELDGTITFENGGPSDGDALVEIPARPEVLRQ